jgi:hypothetical protein
VATPPEKEADIRNRRTSFFHFQITRGDQMTSQKLRSIVLLASAFLFVAAAHGDTIYKESMSGDLSNSGMAPTLLTVSLGLNDVYGTTGKSSAGVIDRDYFTFTIPQGMELASITVLPGTESLGANDVSFIGVESGPQVTVNPSTATDATGLLGWWHYGAQDIGVDILPLMGSAGDNSTGFTAPLPAGTYSFWIQEASVGSVPYGLEFAVITPEPATWTMLLSGLSLLAGNTARRSLRSRS